METLPITPEDQQLIEQAKAIIAKLYMPDKHVVGAALRTKQGQIFTAVHLEANVGRIAVCAEAIALGRAISEGETHFDTIVAVRHPDSKERNQEIAVVSPCGMCRELISDYGPEVKVIFAEQGQLKKSVVLELLPAKYSR